LKAPAETGDHVPAKALFPESRPSNLITVPSCLKCNSGFKQDEDYFLSILSFSDAGVSPVGKHFWQHKYHRMYQKDLGLKNALCQCFEQIQLPTSNGKSETRLAINLQTNRINAVIRKVCRGLYYFECNEPLPVNLSIKVHRIKTKEELKVFNADMKAGSRGWPGVFEYRWNRVATEPALSKWLLLFHGAMPWAAITYPPGRFSTQAWNPIARIWKQFLRLKAEWKCLTSASAGGRQ
jgi:hypothetical protein